MTPVSFWPCWPRWGPFPSKLPPGDCRRWPGDPVPLDDQWGMTALNYSLQKGSTCNFFFSAVYNTAISWHPAQCFPLEVGIPALPEFIPSSEKTVEFVLPVPNETFGSVGWWSVMCTDGGQCTCCTPSMCREPASALITEETKCLKGDTAWKKQTTQKCSSCFRSNPQEVWQLWPQHTWELTTSQQLSCCCKSCFSAPSTLPLSALLQSVFPGHHHSDYEIRKLDCAG